MDGKPDYTWQKNVLNTIPHPCKYGNYGCQEIKMVQELSAHEDSCRYQKIYCPENGCNVDVCLFNFMDHFEEKHKPFFGFERPFSQKMDMSFAFYDYCVHWNARKFVAFHKTFFEVIRK